METTFSWDEGTDILFILFGENCPCIAFARECWVRVDPDTGRVVSIEIPNADSLFWTALQYESLFRDD